MHDFGFSEADWKLFRKRLPVWQERYIARLIEEYKAILNTDEAASSRFWALEQKIRNDQKDTGVLAKGIKRSNMSTLMMNLITEGAVTSDDFDGFSNEYRELLLYWAQMQLQDNG